MTVSLYLLTLVLPLTTVLIIFGMRSLSAVLQARARMANDDGYRQFAASASAAQSEIASIMAAMDTSLRDVRTRIAAIETILKTVE